FRDLKDGPVFDLLEQDLSDLLPGVDPDRRVCRVVEQDRPLAAIVRVNDAREAMNTLATHAGPIPDQRGVAHGEFDGDPERDFRDLATFQMHAVRREQVVPSRVMRPFGKTSVLVQSLDFYLSGLITDHKLYLV